MDEQACFGQSAEYLFPRLEVVGVHWVVRPENTSCQVAYANGATVSLALPHEETMHKFRNVRGMTGSIPEYDLVSSNIMKNQNQYVTRKQHPYDNLPLSYLCYVSCKYPYLGG